MWMLGKGGKSGFSRHSTAEEVTNGINGKGLTAIVTGASSGIGVEITRVLALRGVHVIMAVRNMAAGREVKDKIAQENPSARIDIAKLDLSSMASVRSFASEYKSSARPLNILINNAGVFGTPFTLSEDNIELQFATNHLGHFLLTHLLLDTMINTTQESGREGWIINVSSKSHWYTYSGGIRFHKLNDPSGYNRCRAYGQSKLANILHSHELAKHLRDTGADITVNAVHPGVIYTNIFRYNTLMDGLARKLVKFVFKGVQHGAATVCYVALHPQLNGVSGQYLGDCNVEKPHSKAQDTNLARKLWDFSMELIK